MAKRYDAAIKQLVEAHPEDWIAFMNLPRGPVKVIDADLAAVTPAADKVIFVEAAEPYIAHLEFQASSDIEFDRRMLMYNALLRWRHKVPVRSIAVLLRPEASSSGTTGRYVDASDTEAHLEFRYRLVRVWELSPEVLLAGGLGTLPLAPIGRTNQQNLSVVFQGMDEQLDKIQSGAAADIRTAAYVLLGLRYPREVGRQLLLGVRQMKESVTYQAILEEGEQRGVDLGQVREAKVMILRMGKRLLGEPTSEVGSQLSAINDLQALHAIADRLVDAKDWHEALDGLA
jgi:predicted transposase YdaD